MAIRVLILLPLMAIVLAGCSREERPDLVLGEGEITEMTLIEIETLTGLELPDGTEGMNYLYIRAATKPAFQARLRLPEGTEMGQLAEKTVREEPMAALRSQPWWNPTGLTDARHLEWPMPPEENARASLGTNAEGELILYLSWFPTP